MAVKLPFPRSLASRKRGESPGVLFNKPGSGAP
jgi:hypothetical protein